MTITLFVKPEDLLIFLEITNKLKDLPLENDYKFQHNDIHFTEQMVSNYCWINMDVAEYLKLRCCIGKITTL